ncbi:helix-turn-helix domain-containing protein [Microbacterium sp. A204]|uniref:helix-turn-helix domain-containing protein n=1 Tax=Microbacterium sp. A204 TaxID=3457321 RepID=UPI003FCFDA54
MQDPSETRRRREVAGLALLSDLSDSLVSGAPVEQTVDLVCRTICRLAELRFCGVLIPDASWSSFRFAGGHGFPPEYIDRLNELFLVSVGEQQRDSPTRQAAEQRRTIVNTDVRTAEDFAPWRELAQRFGYRSMASVPLIVAGEVIGVLNGYSSGQRDFAADELASIETLAAQAAVALQVSLLMDARRATISELQTANSALERQQWSLERANEIHQQLTKAALTGNGVTEIARTLSALIDSPVALTAPDGQVISASHPDAFMADAKPTGPEIIAEIRIPGELLGHVRTSGTAEEHDDVRQRAVEHAATVLALEAVKERVVQATEDRLRADFLSDLVQGRLDQDPQADARALRHGVDVEHSYRVSITRVIGGHASSRPRIARELAQIPGSIVSGTGATITALVPADTSPPFSVRVEAMRQSLGLEASLTVGVGMPTAEIADFAESHRGAELCLELARRLGRIDLTLVRDDLGLLAFFVDTRNPDELTANAHRVLGAAITHDRKRSASLIETITTYLDSACSVAATAEQLFVHVNTVKYRLRQLEELCRLDLRNPDDLLQARIATLTLQLL